MRKTMAKIVILAICLYAGMHFAIVSAQLDSNDITPYKNKNFICNHTLWEQYMKPFLIAEQQRFRNQSDNKARDDFENYSGILNQLDKNQYGVPLCNKQKFLECNDENQCVCGTTIAPYRYKEVGSRCLAVEGSICAQDRDCIDNNCRSKNFCGGEEAFLRESKTSTTEKLSYAFIIGVLTISKLII